MGFFSQKKTAETYAKSWGTSAAFSQTRTRRKRKMFDELCEDQRLDDAEQRFKTSVFIRCYDIASTQLRYRFKGLEQIASTFECINPEVLVSKDDDYLHNQAHNLTDIYSSDISADSRNQLLSFRRITKEGNYEY